jgi:hypothetical protein
MVQQPIPAYVLNVSLADSRLRKEAQIKLSQLQVQAKLHEQALINQLDRRQRRLEQQHENEPLSPLSPVHRLLGEVDTYVDTFIEQAESAFSPTAFDGSLENNVSWYESERASLWSGSHSLLST